MSAWTESITKIKNLLANAREVLILTHQNPSHDSLGSSLALFLSLSTAGKKVTVICPTPSTVEFANLVGIDKIAQTLPSKNFIISLDYAEGAIEKVSYNIEGGKFNLVIEPRPGTPPFSPEKAHYTSSGITPDLIFVLDSFSLEELGNFYSDDKEMYSKVTVINIDSHKNNSLFGQINLVEPEGSSTSEIVAFLLQDAGLPFNEDIASNLLAGLSFVSDNFSSNTVGPDLFEATAICLRAGGKRPGGVKAQKTELNQEAPADWLQPKIFKSGTVSSSKGEPTLL